MTAPTGPLTTATRRSLLAALGAAALLPGCGSDGDPPEPGEGAGTEGDAQMLEVLLGLELTAGAAYAAYDSVLDGRALATARLLEGHEREHADALRRAIRLIGSAPADSTAGAARLPTLGDARGALEFLLDLEATATAAYLDALPKLTTPGLRRTVASILANEAQHASVLRGLLGLDRKSVV